MRASALPLYRRLLPGLGLAAALCFAAPAPAQFGEAAGIAESMQPEYLSRDVILFVEGLDLDEGQQIILEALFDDYQSEFDAGLETFKQRFDEMRPELQVGDEGRIMKMVFAPFRERAAEKQRMGQVFLSQIRAILADEQLEQWPAFERRLRREKTLHKGRLAGESTNLFHVLRDIHLVEVVLNDILPVVEEYDLALDRALKARNDFAREIQADMILALQERDAQSSLTMLDRQIALSVALRDVNHRYIDLIAQALPPEDGERFRYNALQMAYPRVYRRTAVNRMFKAALELEDLSEEFRIRILEIESFYNTELEMLNDSLLQLLRDHDPDQARHRAESFAARMRGEQMERQNDPTRDPFRKRNTLGDPYVRQMQDLLTEEQFASLPGSNRYLVPEPTRPAGTTSVNRTNPTAMGNNKKRSGGSQKQADPSNMKPGGQDK